MPSLFPIQSLRKYIGTILSVWQALSVQTVSSTFFSRISTTSLCFFYFASQMLYSFKAFILAITASLFFSASSLDFFSNYFLTLSLTNLSASAFFSIYLRLFFNSYTYFWRDNNFYVSTDGSKDGFVATLASNNAFTNFCSDSFKL